MLAAFGIIHGIAEWGDIFIPIQSAFLSEFWIYRLWDLQQVAWAVSFVFLLQFGATVTAYHFPLKHEVKTFMLQLIPFWGAAVVIIYIFLMPHAYEESSIRYLLGFPAALLTAAAFALERKTFTSYRSSSRIYMSLIALAFGVYAILAGLIVPEKGLPGLDWLSYDNIFSYTLMPIYIWRMLIGLCIAILIIRTLHIFDVEYRERLEIAEGERALAVERQRIAHDLHDGVVQAMYATGLQLQAAAKKIATEPEETTHLIVSSIDRLDQVIANIRRYIYNLEAAGVNETGFQNYIKNIADEFSTAGSIPVTISSEGKQVKLTPKQKQSIAFITQEGLGNVIKHAGASRAEIKFSFLPEALVYTIKDDGVGFAGATGKAGSQNGGMGLKSIRERAEAVSADLIIGNNFDEGGTFISVKIPYSRAKGFS